MLQDWKQNPKVEKLNNPNLEVRGAAGKEVIPIDSAVETGVKDPADSQVVANQEVEEAAKVGTKAKAEAQAATDHKVQEDSLNAQEIPAEDPAQAGSCQFKKEDVRNEERGG